MKNEKWVVSEKEMVINHEGEWIETKKKLTKVNKSPIIDNIIKVLSPLAIITPFILLLFQMNKQEEQEKRKEIARLYKEITLDLQLSYKSTDSSIAAKNSFNRLDKYYSADLALYTNQTVQKLLDTLVLTDYIATYSRQSNIASGEAINGLTQFIFSLAENDTAYYVSSQEYLKDSASINQHFRVFFDKVIYSRSLYYKARDKIAYYNLDQHDTAVHRFQMTSCFEKYFELAESICEKVKKEVIKFPNNSSVILITKQDLQNLNHEGEQTGICIFNWGTFQSIFGSNQDHFNKAMLKLIGN